MLIHSDLIKSVDECKPGKGKFTFWWLGQHSFIVKIANKIIYIDPYLSENKKRQIPPLLSPDEIKHADLILGTHNHSDHIDKPVWPVIAHASTQAKFVLPEAVREKIQADTQIPNERFIGMDDGQSVEIDGIKITAVASAHERLTTDPKTGCHFFLGFVIEADGCTLYHAGDTTLYEGLITKLRPWKFDLMLLPINGRDAKRYKADIIGNMTFQEAVDLAGELKARTAVPTHYDMFLFNSADPIQFEEYLQAKYPEVKSIICQHSVPYPIGD